ncbi:putative FMN hydrolase [Marinobacterium lacunae]|uniref:Putative FMN hydrolase n=1 Tax=Marinobacterium lacunae TaxID=1232683 RepID=A0A081G342_9GAMM|nr:HAD family hydrolase [Marinobacterium lacunae]KEA65197.1 putative FMN hydrolase [Marinobacterium lacunae]
MLKCITFDLDDTLWEVDPVIRQANLTLWQWLEQNAGTFTRLHEPADLVEGSRMRAQLLAEYPEIAHSMTLVRLRLLERGLRNSGFSEQEAEALAAQAFEVFMQARHQVELFEHARSMLEALRAQGLVIGALSNGNADVSLTGLADLFDFQFNADSVGTAKPHPLMFERALEHTGLRPEQVVHIGDHPINDVQAAREVGCWTVWVNLPGQTWPEPARADETVTCLSQIPQALECISDRAAKRATL